MHARQTLNRMQNFFHEQKKFAYGLFRRRIIIYNIKKRRCRSCLIISCNWILKEDYKRIGDAHAGI